MFCSPSENAQRYTYVREAGPNSGQRVNAFQMFSGGHDALGTSWCCWFATYNLDVAFQGAAPIPRGGVCQEVYEQAKANGWFTTDPQPDDLFLYVNADDHAHHIGLVTESHQGVSGNTSEDGHSSNGDRVAVHPLPSSGVVYVRYPR